MDLDAYQRLKVKLYITFCRRVVLIGAGKAAAPMARTVEEILGDRLDEGDPDCPINPS